MATCSAAQLRRSRASWGGRAAGAVLEAWSWTATWRRVARLGITSVRTDPSVVAVSYSRFSGVT